MSENSMVNMQVDADIVKKMVTKNIQAAVLQQLGSPDELISAVIKKALDVKCNSSGNVSRSSFENKYDLLEVLSNRAIRDTCDNAVREFVEENSKKLKDAIKKELSRKATTDKIIGAMVSGATNTLSQSWNFRCDFSFKEK